MGEGELHAEVEQVLDSGGQVIARLTGGRRVLLPRSALEAHGDGFRTGISMADAARAEDRTRSEHAVESGVPVLPIIEERVHVGKRTVDVEQVNADGEPASEKRT